MGPYSSGKQCPDMVGEPYKVYHSYARGWLLLWLAHAMAKRNTATTQDLETDLFTSTGTDQDLFQNITFQSVVACGSYMIYKQ